jgi:hypothetical protein
MYVYSDIDKKRKLLYLVQQNSMKVVTEATGFKKGHEMVCGKEEES